MTTIFRNVVEAITPPPFVNPLNYDGLEYRWKVFVFRPALLQQELKWEAVFLIGICFYIGIIFYGKSYNAKLANKWFTAHLPLLSSQFSQATRTGLTADGYSDFFNFSTGRRNVESLHTVFTLRPRHDFFQWLFQMLWTLVELKYQPIDKLELDFKLPEGTSVPDFVWAVVKKDELTGIKDVRWDLTFTVTKDNPSLPSNLSVLSEYADITENLLKPTFSLTQVLNDPANLTHFRSLSVTDQPRERPETPLTPKEREKHVILTLIAPTDPSATLPLITAVFSFIDNLGKISLRPETKRKIKDIREKLDAELKDEMVKDKNEELMEEKKAAKRKAEEDRISKLSAAEQKKILERDRKRETRKRQGKMVKK